MSLAAPAVRGLGVEENRDPKRPDFTKMPPGYPFRTNRLIRMTAKEMASAFYDGIQRYTKFSHDSGNLMPAPFERDRTEKFRKAWKSEKLYVAWCWPLYYKDARATLVDVLNEKHVSDYLKDKIMEALVEDYDYIAFDAANRDRGIA